MGSDGKKPRFRVIGNRKNGERIVISTHSTEEVARKVLNLLRNGDFIDLHMEEIPETESS
jgi:hypothetical protein